MGGMDQPTVLRRHTTINKETPPMTPPEMSTSKRDKTNTYHSEYSRRNPTTIPSREEHKDATRGTASKFPKHQSKVLTRLKDPADKIPRFYTKFHTVCKDLTGVT